MKPDTPSKPRRKLNPVAEAARQARLRERRKTEGWRRITLWLNPQEAAQVAVLGDAWLGRAVKGLLCNCMAEQAPRKRTRKGQPPSPETFTLAPTPSAVSDTGNPMAEVDALLAQGLSGEAIARAWNDQGRRTKNGKPYRGANLLREWRVWKQGGNG